MAYLIQRTEMKRRSHRRAKLARLREKFAAAKNDEEKSLILAKVSRVSPLISQEEFLGALKPSR